MPPTITISQKNEPPTEVKIGSSMNKAAAMPTASAVRAMKKNATPHGMRATFQTWAENELQDDGETMKFNPDAIGYCMAHNPGDKVKRAYRRNRLWKPRMGIMNAWERHLARPRPQLKAVA